MPRGALGLLPDFVGIGIFAGILPLVSAITLPTASVLSREPIALSA